MKIKNLPEKIFLNVGESLDEQDTVNFNELDEVTWSPERIYDADVAYVRLDKSDLEKIKTCIDDATENMKLKKFETAKRLVQKATEIIKQQNWY